ncbi:hypothetical protein COCSUDRAFT_48944 [Coccomyxa subellipsoidea C-169]|uniref:F-box domain-containing protein n=1 Tax=Coccomyxa subellipsoidea (strain C-169) TaxID=574566 RepID=I0YM11_COCSC|nr:hypothetical protein COCSUDRAFT_48944 [Coccomyxa subellipsoidea C-169]EIE19430.1 hypothetical protein COCSUDRAFT_48944 [Coccomyxa subellipsoidea C-169]|eukprot:XP_005643974.1 hypothetical protein COCSUDRAFT_48944 [Coccomyxa subellipsoidea C-169]
MLAKQPLNLLHRLRNRQLYSFATGTSVSSVRRYYESLGPQAVATDTETFKDHFCKFVGQGEFLVCFDALLHDLVVYRCLGYGVSLPGDSESQAPSRELRFDSFFQVHYRRLVAHGAESLIKDFCLVAHGEQYLILASSTVPLSSTDAAYPRDSVVQNVPVYASTTFHLVRLEDGTVCDRYSISNDCIHLSNNSGVYLHDDLLAILTIHGQAVHLLQVLPGGRMVKVQQFGRHCWDDDELNLSEQAHAEQLWRSSQARSAAAPEQEVHSAAAAPEGSALVEGITQRILAFLFLERYRDGRAPSDALRRFFYSFEAYATLVIWKVQFLDRSRLLLSMGLRNATQVRSNSAYFLVVYDRDSGQVVGFYDNKNEALLGLYLKHTPYFHAACMSQPWARFLTPCPASLHLPDPQSPQPWSQSQVVRRILANVPATAQALCTSPFLDANLFSYDDKLISATLKMRGYTEQPLKFVSRAHPAASRFKSSSIPIRLDDDCTLEQLQSQIVQELLKANNLGDFTLSLNKKEESNDAAPPPTIGSELQYVLRTLPGDEPSAMRAPCTVKYVTFGGSLVVWGSTASGRMSHISIAAVDYIHSQPGKSGSEPRLSARDLSGLYMRLKDGFIHPILIALCAEEGRQPPPSLQLLPTELKLLCLRHLQARDLAALACASRDLRHVASSEVLWEPLLVAEFGAPSPADGLLPGTGAFMHAFGARWTERERRRRQRRRMAHEPRLPYPGTGPHLVVPHSYFPAGAVGGDFDRLPHPFLGFSGTRGSGPFGGAGFGLAAPRRPRWKNLS